MNSNYKTQHTQGFIAFTSLLVISAVTLAIALSIPILGVTEANTSLGFAKGQEALKIAEGCNENALIRLRDSAIYTGGNHSVAGGSCSIAVSGSGSSRTITVTATASGKPTYTKRIQTNIQRTGNSINITSWQELP